MLHFFNTMWNFFKFQIALICFLLVNVLCLLKCIILWIASLEYFLNSWFKKVFEISPCPPPSHPVLVRPSLHCIQHCISTCLREFLLGCQMKKALVFHFSLSLQSYHSYNDLHHLICTWIFRRIYVVHDEVKDKNFELELSWIGEGILYDFIVAILTAHFWMTASTMRFQLCKSEELVPNLVEWWEEGKPMKPLRHSFTL